jgi:hypothetical protein
MQLAEVSGASGSYGIRLIAEVVARLCQANEVEQTNMSLPHFVLSSTAKWHGASHVDVVDRQLCYLPRSRQLARHIPKHETASRPDISWWNPPDEEALYDERALRNAISEACHKLVACNRDISSWMGRDTRSEELERCKLLLRTPQLSKVDVLDLSIAQQELVVHRCYFHQPSRSTLRAKVYRFKEFVREEGYSAYFERADLANSEFWYSVRDAAIPLYRY